MLSVFKEVITNFAGMVLHFKKIQACGNDFVIFNGIRVQGLNFSAQGIQKVCHRKFGIGADGLIVIQSSENHDFKVDYYNSDGSSSFCGNGARASVLFANLSEIPMTTFSFEGYDGIHNFKIHQDQIGISMMDVNAPDILSSHDAFINTGSPHHIRCSDDLSEQHILREGFKLRHDPRYAPNGTNVNLMKHIDDRKVAIVTYERGVEDETLSCGTGAVASALFHAHRNAIQHGPIEVSTKGGTLKVEFNYAKEFFQNIWLWGPALKVFEGVYEWK